MGTVDTSTTTRSGALDAWRGLIMVLMALDHANSLVARGRLESEMWTTQYPDYAGDGLGFLTRLVTHLAAPGFFFLMGAGVILFARARTEAGWSPLKVTTHLATRGLLLVLLQFAVENPAWSWSRVTPPDSTYVGVLYALGISLILLSLARQLPGPALLAVGLAVIVSVELVLPEPTSHWMIYPNGQLLFLWPGLGDGIFVLYPALPWFGVALVGGAFGKWVETNRERALGSMVRIGLGLLAGFAILRVIDGFGNIVTNRGGGWIDFLNVTKYPPSLGFLLLTLGAGLIAAGLFHRRLENRHRGVRHLLVFGRVPLFFYLVHLWVYALMGVMFEPGGVGTGLYISWIAGLLILYPACAWFSGFKNRHGVGSVWRLI